MPRYLIQPNTPLLNYRSPAWLALFLLLALLQTAPAIAAQRYAINVVNSYPHDRDAFTQGLLFAHGELYESTGQNGKSSVRRVDLESGKVLAQATLEDKYFAEGLALVGDRLVQLTWKAGTGVVYDRKTLKRLKTFEYAGQGWGLTYDGKRLIMSDGSNELRFFDPQTYEQTGRLKVSYQGQPLNLINELEMVKGELWANIWKYDLIVRINTETGLVDGVADASGLRQSLTGPYRLDVLNGIAYDEQADRLYLTGKWWPKVFQVELKAIDP